MGNDLLKEFNQNSEANDNIEANDNNEAHDDKDANDAKDAYENYEANDEDIVPPERGEEPVYFKIANPAEDRMVDIDRLHEVCVED